MECCKTGFNWGGKPTGSETKLAGNNAYVTGTNKDAAILIVHDIFGWTFNNTRILADHYAKEADATVYVPDYFGGDVIDPSMLEDEEKKKDFDLMAFIGKNGKDVRGPEIFAGAKALKQQYKKVGAIGFCYGGWAIAQLGGKGQNLMDCVSTAHPSLLEKSEIENLAVPTQILAPEMDPMFNDELKSFANSTIPTLGIDYDYCFFPGLAHGFAIKCDEKDPKAKKGLERAKIQAVCFFSQYLH